MVLARFRRYYNHWYRSRNGVLTTRKRVTRYVATLVKGIERTKRVATPENRQVTQQVLGIDFYRKSKIVTSVKIKRAHAHNDEFCAQSEKVFGIIIINNYLKNAR